MGVISLPSYKDYRSTDPVTAHFWFRWIMSRNRFMEIKRYLHVVENSKIPATNTDILYKIRPTITVLQERCLRMYNTHQQIAIDESMIGTKCHLSFLQYMPKKPIKWDIKHGCVLILSQAMFTILVFILVLIPHSQNIKKVWHMV